MPTHAAAGAGAAAGGLAALVPRERRRGVSLDSRGRASLRNGAGRALLWWYRHVPALRRRSRRRGPWLTLHSLPNTNIDVKTVARPPGGGLACITGRASALDEAPSGWSVQLQRLLVLKAQARRQAFLADRRRW